jgi:hypothetical protein
MTPQETNVRLFHASLTRATRDPLFLQAFYDDFIHSSEDVADLVRGKDMAHIQDKLKMTLEMVSDTADGRPGLTMYLEMLGRIHQRLDITPGLFAQWRRSLIDTAARCDPVFDAQTRVAWEQVIDDVIAKMHTDDGDTVS